MKSDVVKVSLPELGTALNLVEKTAIYIGYSVELASKMRLLAEELIASNRLIIDEVDASLWVETTKEFMEIHLKLEGELSESAREKMVDISKSQCNMPPKGLFGKIGAFFSDAFMQEANGYVPLFTVDGGSANQLYMPFSVFTEIKENEKPEEQDEMSDVEKNILKGLADDVTVCARATHAELVVMKKLPDEKENAQ